MQELSAFDYLRDQQWSEDHAIKVWKRVDPSKVVTKVYSSHPELEFRYCTLPHGYTVFVLEREPRAFVGLVQFDNLVFTNKVFDKVIKSSKNLGPYKVKHSHVTLSPSVQGRGIALYLYSMILNRGYSLITDGHTIQAGQLWGRVSALMDIPILWVDTDSRSSLNQIVLRDADDPKARIKLLLGKGAYLNESLTIDKRTK